MPLPGPAERRSGIFRDGMTRAPVFAARDISHAAGYLRLGASHRQEIASAAESTTSHGRLTGITTAIGGTSVFVRLEFDTKDAMGMNMVTIASAKAAETISAATGARLIALSGNLCTDKKPAAVNLVLGRGRTVAAGVFLSDALVREVFKTDTADACRGEYAEEPGRVRPRRITWVQCPCRKHRRRDVYCLRTGSGPRGGGEPCGNHGGSCRWGSLCLGHAAIPAGRGRSGEAPGSIPSRNASPCSGLPAGGNPPGANAKKFAEIIAAAVLAGELSLLGALGAQHLARAHQHLGR